MLISAPLCHGGVIPGHDVSPDASSEVEEKMSPKDALSYLGHYGYLSPSPSNITLFDRFEEGLQSFQRYFGLSPSGILDLETSKALKKPRCGVKDQVGDIKVKYQKPIEIDLMSASHSGSHQQQTRRVKRFSAFDNFFLRDIMDMFSGSDGALLTPSRWRSLALTYRVSKYPAEKKLSKKVVDREIEKAFAMWSNVTDLSFTNRHYGPVHIELSFEKSAHGDREPFDGEGGVLAHTFYPLHGGDVHFDEEEDWVQVQGFWSRGTHFGLVAAHEIGHALGLEHISDPSALMFPTIDDHKVYDVKLGSEDIKAIQRLYGPRTKRRVSAATSSPERNSILKQQYLQNKNKTLEGPKWKTSLCEGKSKLKLFNVDNSVYLVHKDKASPDHKVWIVDNSGGVKHETPLGSVSTLWPGMPRTPDAGFTWTNGLTYFFVGTKYYRYSNKSLDQGFPKRMKHGFPGIPPYLDAAFLSQNKTQIIFVKNNKYWTFSPSHKPPLLGSDKLPDGIANVETGIQFNSRLYLFNPDSYWRLKSDLTIDNSPSPPYPRIIRNWWFDCNK